MSSIIDNKARIQQLFALLEACKKDGIELRLTEDNVSKPGFCEQMIHARPTKDVPLTGGSGFIIVHDEQHPQELMLHRLNPIGKIIRRQPFNREKLESGNASVIEDLESYIAWGAGCRGWLDTHKINDLMANTGTDSGKEKLLSRMQAGDEVFNAYPSRNYYSPDSTTPGNTIGRG